MYRFALRPAWIASHLFALGLVVLFVNLGFWQLDRHGQRAARNETIGTRTELPAAPVTDVVGEASGEELRYRPVVAEGTYVEGADFLIDNRSNEGLPGAWVVTPLRLDDGSLLAVSRGFQAFDSGRIDIPTAPEDTVRVEGTLLPWDGRDCGVRTGETGRPLGTACLRRSVAEDLAGGEVLPVVLQRQESVPADAGVLQPVPLPERDAGPHRSYAVQWFIFATIGLVGYPLILRRVARDRAGGPEPSLDSETDRGLVSQPWGRS